MQLNNPDLPAINPRRVVTKDGESELALMLRDVGYVIQYWRQSDLAHVLRGCLPWLIEGSYCGGKTALAEGPPQACTLPVFYLQGI